MAPRASVINVLRLLVVAMIVLYAASIYLETHMNLSTEARQYQADYPDAIRNGFSLMAGLLKLLFLVGTIAGLVGAMLVLLGSSKALPYILMAGPLMAVAAYLNAPQSTYPSVEPMLAEILWCATSAAWAGVVALTWVHSPRMGNLD
jgi:hypothetical protein